MRLNQYDLQWCVRLLPKALRDIMKKEEIVVAGGYVRSCVTRETVNDIDLFIPERDYALHLAAALSVGAKPHRTVNAITVRGLKYPVQFITRWVYDAPQEVLSSFDFTICQAAFWWDHYCQRWASAVSDDFYVDLAAKRLVYTNPVREEAPGGSMLRVLKYYQRGYRITIKSLSDVIARLAHGVRFDYRMVCVDELDTLLFAHVVKGLLHEVDPSIDPDHIIEEN